MKLDKVEDFIKKHHLLKKGTTVVVGVSGGPDSISLLHYLWKTREKWSLTIIAAHVDHMFRGSESYEDLLFVKRFCNEYNILFEGNSIDVSAYARTHQLSSQVAARECRYDFYKLVMEKYNGDYLALAHHADDQVETMLMRLVRGSYGIGLAGIPIKRSFYNGTIIRPFLCLTKYEIEQYIDEFNLQYRIDPSNDKDAYQRNRFRHHIMPFLKKENPNVAERFQTLSEYITEDNELLEALAHKEIEGILVEKNEQKVVFSISQFLLLPISLQRRGIQLILKYLYKTIPSNITTIHNSQLLSLLSNEHPSGMLNFPKGLVVTRSYDQCTLAFSGKCEKVQPFDILLPVPGEVSLNGYGSIKAEWIDHLSEKLKSIDFFVCDSKEIALPIHIRSRNNGDRMTIKGMKGTKKIKDIFIDEKIPMEKRSLWPIVTDANGNVLWLPYLKKSAFSIESQKNNYQKNQQQKQDNGTRFLLLHYLPYNEEL
ncbi:tRNA lysidine(34) synthetase TilS [Calidifontibacillus oryziterrae]|uniref:tRNA lysidine(34) synthetase TilS n=1 Tax=Calidifontibacillus oryziterrae TaxID=1191699 RepID=UPI00030ECB99|nr:tRNA lysidine(34) synthetase TilS [Calidifontibacillus oryziterrae]